MIFFISENSRIDEKELRCGKTFRMHSTKWNMSHKVGNTNLQMISEKGANKAKFPEPVKFPLQLNDILAHVVL
jgi:hypothetical protein